MHTQHDSLLYYTTTTTTTTTLGRISAWEAGGLAGVCIFCDAMQGLCQLWLTSTPDMRRGALFLYESNGIMFSRLACFRFRGRQLFDISIFGPDCAMFSMPNGITGAPEPTLHRREWFRGRKEQDRLADR